MSKIPYGYCQCGCGMKTNIAPQNQTRGGWVKGEPLKWLVGHSSKKNGTTTIRGRKLIFMPEHYRADTRGYVLQSILKAEKAIGKPLPKGAIVHHALGDKTDDSCLVICPDEAYHHLLHQRLRAYKACGNSNWRSCCYCHEYDSPENLIFNNKNIYHRDCRSIYFRNWYANRGIK